MLIRDSYSSHDALQAAEKRRYLGGDSEHTVLVKGLDFALLEQNKAKATVSPTDDDDLEHAFIEVPKKRTREQLVRQLIEKRAKEATPTSDAPIATNSKFKPIGFKPIDEGTKKKKKKLKIVDGDKKKKSKVDPVPSEPDPPSASVPPPPKPQPIQEPEPPDDFDIFADAGEYKGLDVGDDDDSDEDVAPADTAEQPTLGARPGHWFDEPSKSPEPATSASESRSLPPRVPLPTDDDGGQEEDADVPMRLVPLEGSSVPSIKELLALDQAVGSADKKRKRKEKNKGKKDDSEGANKASTEAKVDRDYKRWVMLLFSNDPLFLTTFLIKPQVLSRKAGGQQVMSLMFFVRHVFSTCPTMPVPTRCRQLFSIFCRPHPVPKIHLNLNE